MTRIQNLIGKTAIITASTEGIGFAIARRLGQHGANIVVSSRKESNIDAAVTKLQQEGLNVAGVKCHVSHPKHRSRLIDTALSTFGGIDIVISNAAVNPEVGPLLELSEFSWNRLFDVNVKAAFMLAKETYPHLKSRGGGNIVFVSSIAGYQPWPSLGGYAVTKTALLGLTKAVSQDVAAENIRVNCIAPGIVKTKFSKMLYESPEAEAAAMKVIPMKRFAVTEDIAGTVAFLVSDDAGYITGETICVAGGMSSRL